MFLVCTWRIKKYIHLGQIKVKSSMADTGKSFLILHNVSIIKHGDTQGGYDMVMLQLQQKTSSSSNKFY